MFKDWAVERERDASLRAWELNVVADYGLGEYAGRLGRGDVLRRVHPVQLSAGG